MYIIYEQRLLLGKALSLFFFLCWCRDLPSCSRLHSFTPFLAVSLTVSYCRSFLLQSPYFQSPECHKAPRQKETQFPELSLQTSSLQLKTATHLCQRMAHFMNDTSASLLLAPLTLEYVVFPLHRYLFFFFWFQPRMALDFFFLVKFIGENLLMLLLNPGYLTQIWPPGHTARLWCWHKRILMAARFIGFKWAVINLQWPLCWQSSHLLSTVIFASRGYLESANTQRKTQTHTDYFKLVECLSRREGWQKETELMSWSQTESMACTRHARHSAESSHSA